MFVHLIIAVIVALSTWLVGWWSVAVVAIVAGFLMRAHGGRAWAVAFGSAEGWAILLLVDTLGGRSRELLSLLAGTMKIPGPALLIVTLLFPALIGWSGAALAAELSQLSFFTRTDSDAHASLDPR
jgi:hypothetical protein